MTRECLPFRELYLLKTLSISVKSQTVEMNEFAEVKLLILNGGRSSSFGDDFDHMELH